MFSINRSKVWITSRFAGEFAPEGHEGLFSDIQKLRWENHRDEFLEYRREVESAINKSFEMMYRDSELQKWASQEVPKLMRERLNNDKELMDKISKLGNLGQRTCSVIYSY